MEIENKKLYVKADREPYFKIDSDYLMRQIKGDHYQITLAMVNAIRSIFYLLEVAGLQINEDLYNKLDDDGKEFFKKV